MLAINIIWSFLLVMGGVTILLLAVQAIRRWPTLGLLVLGVQVVFLFETPSSFILISAGGLNIAFLDLVALAFLIAYVGKKDRLGGSSLPKYFVAYSLILALSIVVGITTFGVNLAANEAREFIWMIACLLWSSSLEWQSFQFRRRVLRLMVGLGCVLVVTAAVHLASFGFGGYGENFVNAQGDAVERRILSSGQALMMFCSLLCAMALSRSEQHAKTLVFLGASFGVVIILSQQRTVWAVAAICLTVAFVLDRRTRLAEYLWAAIALVVIIVILATGSLDALMVTLSKSLASTTTYDGRVEGWLALIQRSVDQGPGAILLGQPFGSGFSRLEGGQVVSFSPHNWYVSLFLRTGIVGLILYCLGVLVTLFLLIRRRASLLFFLFVLAVVIYSWTYNATWYGATLVGAGIAISAQRRPSESDASLRGALSPLHTSHN